MSGICGSTNDAQRRHVARMNSAMVARGPDEARTYADYFSGVSLGARRLRIFGIKGGHQPLTNEDGTGWAVLGGEIDNHLELRERLLAPRATFRLKVDN